MRVHITNIYGMRGAAAIAQNNVTAIAQTMPHYTELGIFRYKVSSDTPEMLKSRLDGILASVRGGDIVIFQFPTWNGIEFEEALTRRADIFGRIKKIFFIHDVPPLMFESNRYLLKRYIDLYNRADLLILPSQKMADLLHSEGLTVTEIVVQRMWDCPVTVDLAMAPVFHKVVNFAVSNVNVEKFSFVKRWKYDSVKLAVTVGEKDLEPGGKIIPMGWFNDQNLLANAFRGNGGFGLLWSGDPYWMEYMKFNTCMKLGLYLAAGLPVIVPDSIPEAGTILRKNLGVTAGSLDEAVAGVESMSKEQYGQMVSRVGEFGELLRGGYFTRKLLTDAVFKVLHD